MCARRKGERDRERKREIERGGGEREGELFLSRGMSDGGLFASELSLNRGP